MAAALPGVVSPALAASPAPETQEQQSGTSQEAVSGKQTKQKTKGKGQALAGWQNILIEGATLLVIGVSALITAQFYDFDSPDPVVKVRAAVFALGVDVAYYISVLLTRLSLSGRYWSRWWTLFWLVWVFFWGAFSYMNNLFFIAGFWILNPEALARTGIPEWFVLHVAALVPQAIVMMMACVPRAHAKDTRTPEQRWEELRRKLEERKLLGEYRTDEAALLGKGIRGLVGGLMTGKNELERRQEAEERANQQHVSASLAPQPVPVPTTLPAEASPLSSGTFVPQPMTPGFSQAFVPPAPWLPSPADRDQGQALRSQAWGNGAALGNETGGDEQGRSMVGQELVTQGATSAAPGPAENVDQQEWVKADPVLDMLGYKSKAPVIVGYWTKPDYQGPYKLSPEEVRIQEDGTILLALPALLRLVKAYEDVQKRKKEKNPKTRNTQKENQRRTAQNSGSGVTQEALVSVGSSSS